MKIIKLVSVVILFTMFSNVSISEEKVKCNDIKKYLKRMACKTKSAKNIIGSKINLSKESFGKILKKNK